MSLESAYRELVLGRTKGWLATAARAALRAFSWPYGMVVRLRNSAYDAGWLAVHRAPAPVVCVGNLTVGGTGKTPFVECIARHFQNAGQTVVVLSRGYGSRHGPNDEALVLFQNLPTVPHLQGRDRVHLARRAVDWFGPCVVVLDDGFQHRRLHRDLNFALLDASAPFGGGHLLPGGLLREPLTGLRRADAVILTRADLLSESQRAGLRELVFHQAGGERTWIEVRFAPRDLLGLDENTLPLECLAGRPVFAFCGIGNPEPFFQTIVELGAKVVGQRIFPDHHNYSERDIKNVMEASQRAGAGMLLATQKDVVKIQPAWARGVPTFALRIGAEIMTGAEELKRLLEHARHAGSPSPAT